MFERLRHKPKSRLIRHIRLLLLLKRLKKTFKPTRIIILKVRSTFLGNLSTKDKVEVKEVKDNRKVGPMTIRQGKKAKLLV